MNTAPMPEPHIVKLFSWGGHHTGACHDFLMSDGSIKCFEHNEALAMRKAHREAMAPPTPAGDPTSHVSVHHLSRRVGETVT